MVTTIKSLVHSNSDNSQMVTPFTTTTELSTTLSTHNRKPQFLKLGGREGGGGAGRGGGGPAPAPCPSIYNTSIVTTLQPVQNSNRYNTSIGTTLQSVSDTYHRSCVVTIETGRRHPGARYTIAMARKKTSRGPVYQVNETGRRHPGARYTM